MKPTHTIIPLKKDYQDGVIFLDCDGVLNHPLIFQQQGTRLAVSGDAIRRLKWLVDKTNASIVLSSTWRMYPNMLDLLEIRLAEFNMAIEDITALEWEGSSRGQEIYKWLMGNQLLDSRGKYPTVPCVIIDDHKHEVCDIPVVLTSMRGKNPGLNDHHIKEAIEYLSSSFHSRFRLECDCYNCVCGRKDDNYETLSLDERIASESGCSSVTANYSTVAEDVL